MQIYVINIDLQEYIIVFNANLCNKYVLRPYFMPTFYQVNALKGPSQPHRYFCLHARVWQL